MQWMQEVQMCYAEIELTKCECEEPVDVHTTLCMSVQFIKWGPVLRGVITSMYCTVHM